MSRTGRRKLAVLWTAAAGIGLLGMQMVLNSRVGGAQPPASAPPAAAEQLSVVAFSPVDAGRYLVKITGCNDCHTPGWMQMPGSVPESMWLTGVPVGFSGPWGTSYASNLRRFVKDFNADTFVQVIRARNQKPPMPWDQLHAMSDSDLRAVFAYIKSLGPGGEATPVDTPPNEEPMTPYFWFVPQMAGSGSEKHHEPVGDVPPTTQKSP